MRSGVPAETNAVTYAQAGVSLEKAEAVSDRLRATVARAATGRTVGSPGGFAGLYELDARRVLAASTDGVGSKLVLARRAGRLRAAGADLAAHCINDVLTAGADPLFLLDYVAASSIDLDEVAEVVAGVADVCELAGCALLGGETAELPGIYRKGELDVAGTCVGIVDRDRLIDGSRCREGDVVLGLPSSGLHANGFSLIRTLVGDGAFDADLLLAPTRLYLEDIRELRHLADVRALAHITGGGIAGNLPRALPVGLRARIDPTAWERPPVFDWLDENGIEEDEQRRVFNLGIGFCAVVPERDRDAGLVIGRLERGARGVVWL